MTLEQLRSFRAVIETGSFRAAAERVHRSQPAVSLQIQALEKACGGPLLERKGCRPTPAGRRVYARAVEILAHADSLAKELREMGDSSWQTLRAGASDTTALYVLPAVVLALTRSMPLVRLTLVNRPSEALAELVIQGGLDLALATLPMGSPDLEEHDLFEEQLVLVAPRSHRLGRRRTASLAELEKEPVLLLDPATRTGATLTDFFHRQSFTPHVVLESGSFEVIKRYVASGLGIAFLPRIALTPSDLMLTAIRVKGLPSIRIGAVWRRGAYQTRSEKLFLELVAKHAAKLRTPKTPPKPP